jgi:hypothetical protein
LIADLQNIFLINQLIVIKINLPPSNAGIGSKLNTHKFILIIAVIINKNLTQAESEFVIKSTIQIGQLIC